MAELDGIKDVDVDASDLRDLKQSFDACDSNADGWIVNREFSALLRTLDQDLSEDECLLAFEAHRRRWRRLDQLRGIHGLVE